MLLVVGAEEDACVEIILKAKITHIINIFDFFSDGERRVWCHNVIVWSVDGIERDTGLEGVEFFCFEEIEWIWELLVVGLIGAVLVDVERHFSTTLLF